MTVRHHFPSLLLFACTFACSAPMVGQTIPSKPRVFVSYQYMRAGQHLDRKPTEPIDVKQAQLISDTCQTIVVTTTPDDADYFLLWWRGGFRDAFALYDRQGRLLVRGSTDEPERGHRIAQTLCRFVNKTEKPRRHGLHQFGG
jgi:hypothetical protein